MAPGTAHAVLPPTLILDRADAKITLSLLRSGGAICLRPDCVAARTGAIGAETGSIGPTGNGVMSDNCRVARCGIPRRCRLLTGRRSRATAALNHRRQQD